MTKNGFELPQILVLMFIPNQHKCSISEGLLWRWNTHIFICEYIHIHIQINNEQIAILFGKSENTSGRIRFRITSNGISNNFSLYYQNTTTWEAFWRSMSSAIDLKICLTTYEKANEHFYACAPQAAGTQSLPSAAERVVQPPLLSKPN